MVVLNQAIVHSQRLIAVWVCVTECACPIRVF
jgi:hypothetical protein